MSGPRFHVDIYAPPEKTIVRAHGEIDMATAAAFRAALTAGLDRQPPLLVVDLGGVSHLGACGLGVLVGARNRAAPAGIQITVVGARPHVYRVFELTHLVARLDVQPPPPGPGDCGEVNGREYRTVAGSGDFPTTTQPAAGIFTRRRTSLRSYKGIKAPVEVDPLPAGKTNRDQSASTVG